MSRIIGLETEYGCLVTPPEEARLTVQMIRNWIFEGQRYGLIDLHDRDWDEPAGNGGFLFNGGRVYVDMGHLEYCTPECVTALDIARYNRAGDMILQEAVEALGLADRVSIIRNNIDHYTGATFGCHENYSILRQAPLTERNVYSLLAFLTLRVLMTGSGRVGSTREGHWRGDRAARGQEPFQISQRADYIQNEFYEWVQHNRSIINTRDEPLADPCLYRRLHLLHGDSNVLPATDFLKVGSTRLVLDLLEEDDLPAIELRDAVGSMRAISRQLTPPWRVRRRDGKELDALEALAIYRERAAARWRGRDEDTDAILDLWQRVERGLAEDRDSLVGLVDWASKYTLLDEFRRSEGLEWNHPWMESQDLEYHHLDMSRNLAWPMADLSGPWGVKPKRDPRLHAPDNTRALSRSRRMRDMQKRGSLYLLDWESVAEINGPTTLMLDPFKP
jgi:proteasome accessory factor A